MKYFEIIAVLFSSFVGGFTIGGNVSSKGYLYGLRLSAIIILLFIIFGIIFNSICFANIIYYLIITICITFGSMLGIMKKAK